MHPNKLLLLSLVKNYGTQCLYNKVKKHYPFLLVRIYAHAVDKFALSTVVNMSFTEKMYCYIYDLAERPRCLFCGDTISRFYSFGRGYAMFCSNKCVAKSGDVQNQRKKTLNSKYNIPAFFRKNKKKKGK